MTLTLRDLKKAVDDALANGVHPLTSVKIGAPYDDGIRPYDNVESAQFVARNGTAFVIVRPAHVYEDTVVSDE